jgi:membrane protein implicated in regulation of membrane protease activity
MLEIYWICLIFGICFAFATIVLGELLGQVVDGICDFVAGEHLEWLEPMLIVTWLTVFGGSGILANYYTNFDVPVTLLVSVLAATILCILLYFAYIRPMRNSENSTGVSQKDLRWKTGEIIVPVPAHGYGEVLIRVGAMNTNQIAASYHQEDLPAGCQIVVVEIKDGVVYVAKQAR